MDLRRQLSIVRAWLPLVIGAVVLAAAAAYFISGTQAKVYEAKATLIVGQSLSGNPDYNQLLVSQRLTATYATVATTRPILVRVIDKLGLPDGPDELVRRVSAIAAPDSALLTISARDGDPERAAAIANALADDLVAASPAVQGQQADLQQSIDEDLEAIRTEIRATQAEIERLAALPERTPAVEATLETLQGRVVTLRSTYATLLTFSGSQSSNRVSVVQPAVAPAEPVAPRPLLNALLAAMVGLLVASAIAFVMEYLDDTIKDSDEVRATVGLPTLATMLRMRSGRGRPKMYGLATLLYPHSPAAEAYRTLRANVEFASIAAPISTLLVTSAAPSEGKTVTATNLAVAFAQAGQRVLLIDADLRQPEAHELLRLPNERGLTTLLRNDEIPIETVLHSTEQQNLFVLTSGPLPPNPAELLGSQRMRTVLASLRPRHDLLIFDSPPIGIVTDAVVLSSFLDGTILVVNTGRTRSAAVRQAREALSKAGANVIGVVLNGRTKRVYPDYHAYFPSVDIPAGEPLFEPARTLGASPPPPSLTNHAREEAEVSSVGGPPELGLASVGPAEDVGRADPGGAPQARPRSGRTQRRREAAVKQSQDEISDAGVRRP